MKPPVGCLFWIACVAALRFAPPAPAQDFSASVVVGEADAAGCDGDFYLNEDAVLVVGTAPVPVTAELRVNGHQADLDPLTGNWSYRTTFSGGPPGTLLALSVEAFDANGTVVNRRNLRAIRVSALQGEFSADTRLTSTGSPYLVIGQLSLPVGHSLRIDAGCEFLFEPDVGFDISGEVQALGSPGAPIRFTRVPCGENWGFFSMEGARGDNRFWHCEWSWSTGDPGCLTVDDSNLELDRCTLRDIDGEGVHAEGSTTRIRRCLTERTREALSLDSGDTVVEFCTVRDAIGDSDLIDTNDSDPPARIFYNHIYNTQDDGIDVDRGSVIMVGNIIHDCGDQAFSLVGTGNSTVRHNVCYRNNHGLSVKDSHVCLAEFNTIVGNDSTGVRAIEDTSGRGAGIITLRNSIVWGNGTDLLVEVEDGGVLDVSYSNVEEAVVPGPGNFSLEPLFVDFEAGDFHLLAGSPCIGAADTGEDIGALPFASTLEPPQVFRVEPGAGPSAGGTPVIIRGRNFLQGVEASLGGRPLVDLVLIREDELRGVTPAGAPGPVDVVVTTPRGQAVLPSGFSYVDSYPRGDANGDGGINLADPVAILSVLFRRGVAPPCRDAADANTDGAVNVSDAVFLLLFLYAGGSSPEPATVECRAANAGFRRGV